MSPWQALILIILVLAYWVPAIVALTRRVRNSGSVIVINLLTGWTVIGWVVALAMACRSKDRGMPRYNGGGEARKETL